MNDDEWNLKWSGIWFLFISLLCFIFNSATPLVLLIIWFFGWRS